MAYVRHTEKFVDDLITFMFLLVIFGFLVGCSSPPAPERFSETIVFDYSEKKYVDFLRPDPLPFEYEEGDYQVDRPEKVTFEMIRIAGNDRTIKPFYLAKTEVTSAMFLPWVSGIGLNKQDYRDWTRYDLHPSWMPAINFELAFSDRPALGMSRRVAELYCQWLSQHTGRNYRLPTEMEWRHALALGGDVSHDPIELKRQAIVVENAELLHDPPFINVPAPVGSRWPNGLGLYDMLGNAAEWVTDTGEDRVIVGGHYLLKATRLKPGWREVEDARHWDAWSPYKPSDWHYSSFHQFQGIRLACDADQAPKTASDAAQSPENPTP